MISIFIVFVSLLCFAFYFLPSIIAISKKKENTLAIFVLNFFLGWSLIGWVISLVWALVVEQKTPTVIINNDNHKY